MAATFAGLEPEMFLRKRSFTMKANMYGPMKWLDASSGASWQPALSGGGPKPLLPQVQRRRMKGTPQRGLTHRSSGSGINSGEAWELQKSTRLRILQPAHCVASRGALACIGFVVSGVPAKSRPPGSARSGAAPVQPAAHATDS
jgi:hypothetical protein